MKEGTSIIGVSPEMVVGLIVIAGVFAERGVQCMVTACTDGTHMIGSLHYVGRAVDLRLPSRYTGDTATDMAIALELRSALGNEWDVVLENDHLHLEFDPKPKVKETHA